MPQKRSAPSTVPAAPGAKFVVEFEAPSSTRKVDTKSARNARGKKRTVAPASDQESPTGKTNPLGAGLIFEHAKRDVVVRVTESAYKGQRQLHFREWYRKGDALAPSPKGCNIPWAEAPELLKALAGAIQKDGGG